MESAMSRCAVQFFRAQQRLSGPFYHYRFAAFSRFLSDTSDAARLRNNSHVVLNQSNISSINLLSRPLGAPTSASLGAPLTMKAMIDSSTGDAPSLESALLKGQAPLLRYNGFYSHNKAQPRGLEKYLFWLLAACVIFWASDLPAWLDNWLIEYYQARLPPVDHNSPSPSTRSVKAESAAAVSREGAGLQMTAEQNANDDDIDEKKAKRVRVGFRDRRVIDYEDRLRRFSTPDKIFRYFATLQYKNDVYMTPEDFVRSITPGMKQPDGLGLDSFKRIHSLQEIKMNDSSSEPGDELRSVFYSLGDKALINFTDYLFLLTVLSTPPRQFEIAFRMFDLNGDGDLDMEEFERVRELLRSQTSAGKRHRDHGVTGNTLAKEMNSALQTHFFGADGQQKLTIVKMLEFQSRLQEEIMRLEFQRYADAQSGLIAEVDFAELLLAYADFTKAKNKKLLRKIRQTFRASDGSARGISFNEYCDFQRLLKSISEVDTALSFYHLAGASIDQSTLRHVTKSVANVDLSDHLLEVVFTLFDSDGDGQLSNKEFVSVMKSRLLRGLDHPMDTGFVRFVSAMGRCAVEQVLGSEHGNSGSG